MNMAMQTLLLAHLVRILSGHTVETDCAEPTEELGLLQFRNETLCSSREARQCMTGDCRGCKPPYTEGLFQWADGHDQEQDLVKAVVQGQVETCPGNCGMQCVAYVACYWQEVRPQMETCPALEKLGKQSLPTGKGLDVVEKFRKGELIVHMRNMQVWDSPTGQEDTQALVEMARRTSSQHSHNSPKTTTSQQIQEWAESGRMYPVLSTSFIHPELKGSVTWYTRGYLLDLQKCQVTAGSATDLALNEREQMLLAGGQSKAQGLLEQARFAATRDDELGKGVTFDGYVPKRVFLEDIDAKFASERSALHALAEKNPELLTIMNGSQAHQRQQVKDGILGVWNRWLDRRYYFPIFRQGSHTEVVANCSVDALRGGVVTRRGYAEGYVAGKHDEQWEAAKLSVSAFLQQARRDVPQLQKQPLVLAQYHPGGGVSKDGFGCFNKYCGDTCHKDEELPPAELEILDVI